MYVLQGRKHRVSGAAAVGRCRLLAALLRPAAGTGTAAIAPRPPGCRFQNPFHPSLPALCERCSRPTAVNLADAAQRLSLLASEAAAAPGATAAAVTMAVVEACERMLRDDVEANKVGWKFKSVGFAACLLCAITHVLRCLAALRSLGAPLAAAGAACTPSAAF